jgi:hypothetical protein
VHVHITSTSGPRHTPSHKPSHPSITSQSSHIPKTSPNHKEQDPRHHTKCKRSISTPMQNTYIMPCNTIHSKGKKRNSRLRRLITSEKSHNHTVLILLTPIRATQPLPPSLHLRTPPLKLLEPFLGFGEFVRCNTLASIHTHTTRKSGKKTTHKQPDHTTSSPPPSSLDTQCPPR